MRNRENLIQLTELAIETVARPQIAALLQALLDELKLLESAQERVLHSCEECIFDVRKEPEELL
jgi:hypothetical protein